MPPVKLPYLECTLARGRPYFYYRRAGRRLKLLGDPSRPGFLDEYQNIHDRFETEEKGRPQHAPDSIAALIADFKQSTEFASLSEKSKKDYRRYLDQIESKFGRFPAKSFTRRAALAWGDSMKDKPATRNYAMAVLRRFFSFVVDRGVIQQNPVLKPKKLKIGTHAPWPQEYIDLFLAKAPLPLRRALTLGLYTGQRHEDIIPIIIPKITTEVIEGMALEGINIYQHKNKRALWIPLHRELKLMIEEIRAEMVAGNLPSLMLLRRENGKAFSPRQFDREFLDARRALGIPEQYVFHGLRKNATVKLLEAGCTPAQVKAITGHATDEMVNFYGAQVNQKRLAAAAIALWEGKK